MHSNHVKHKLQAGEASIGTMMFEFNTTGIGRLAAAAGAEFALYDMEHTGWSIESMRMLIATTPKAEMVPIVRIPATEYHFTRECSMSERWESWSRCAKPPSRRGCWSVRQSTRRSDVAERRSGLLTMTIVRAQSPTSSNQRMTKCYSSRRSKRLTAWKMSRQSPPCRESTRCGSACTT